MPPSRWRRAGCRRCRACGTAGRPRPSRPGPGRPSRRAARSRPRSARRRSRGRRASACWDATPRARSGCRAPPLASRRPATWKTWPWKSAISPANSARQIFIASPMRHQRPRRLDAGRLEIGRRAGAEAEDHPAGIHLVEASPPPWRCSTGCIEYGLIAIRAILMRRVAPERQRRRRHRDRAGRDGRRSTASRRRPPRPPAPAPGCRRSARGRPSRCRAQPW